MRKQLLLTLHTVRHLKPRQLWYQLWYRIKNRFIRLSGYDAYNNSSLYPVLSNCFGLIPGENKYRPVNRFSFLNQHHAFPSDIDWNFMGYGKLWNYNLQYFDWIHDESIPEQDMQRMIDSMSAALLDNSVRLEPYPVSLRIVNWIIYFSRTGYRSAVFEKALKCQIHYLRNNLEYHVQANHLMENDITLVFGAILLNDEELFMHSCRRLQKDLDEQILPDGAHYECSPMYHCILLGKLLLLLHMMRTKASEPDWLRSKVESMLSWLRTFSFNQENWAHVNDATNGIAPDIRSIRAMAERLDLVTTPTPMNASGFRKFASGGLELLFDACNIMPVFQPGHTHSDMLQVVISQ
ncbi:MAG: hypothetical protein JO301_09870, partial [Chitinophagaceae bacterium]|nr:hypothetical protein [Chitinophagaceae bacterium]